MFSYSPVASSLAVGASYQSQLFVQATSVSTRPSHSLPSSRPPLVPDQFKEDVKTLHLLNEAVERLAAKLLAAPHLDQEQAKRGLAHLKRAYLSITATLDGQPEPDRLPYGEPPEMTSIQPASEESVRHGVTLLVTLYKKLSPSASHEVAVSICQAIFNILMASVCRDAGYSAKPWNEERFASLLSLTGWSGYLGHAADVQEETLLTEIVAVCTLRRIYFGILGDPETLAPRAQLLEVESGSYECAKAGDTVEAFSSILDFFRQQLHDMVLENEEEEKEEDKEEQNQDEDVETHAAATSNVESGIPTTTSKRKQRDREEEEEERDEEEDEEEENHEEEEASKANSTQPQSASTSVSAVSAALQKQKKKLKKQRHRRNKRSRISTGSIHMPN